LDELLATLRAGRGTTMWIEGVPGIGKSALLVCGRERADAADGRRISRALGPTDSMSSPTHSTPLATPQFTKR
jgi:hypothetical protein